MVKRVIVGSMARRLKRRYYGDRVITIAWSKFNLHSRRVVAFLEKALCDIFSACWHWAQQFNWEEVKEATRNIGNRQVLSEWGLVQNIALLSLSRDKRIKMEQANEQTNKPTNVFRGYYVYMLIIAKLINWILKCLLQVREVWRSNLEPIKSPARCQRLATAATLKCGPWLKVVEMGTAHSWHPKGWVLSEYN